MAVAKDLEKDALRHLANANARVGLACLYRDYAQDGEVERALLVKARLEAMPAVTAVQSRDPAGELSTRYPELGRITQLLDLAGVTTGRAH